jgi:hypothetical protein
MTDARLYRRATAAALIVAPAIFLADNLLHPTEYRRDNEAKQLAEIADAYTRWQLAHALGFLAIMIFAAGTLGLAFLVRRVQPGLGLAGGAFGVVGLLGLASAITLDGFTWGTLGHVYAKEGADSHTVALALHEVQQSGWSLVFYLPALAWITGLLLLAIGVWRQRAVLPWSAAVFALGSLMVGTETLVTDNADFIAGAAVLGAGSAAIGLQLALMSDEQFAAGGVSRRT